MRQPGSPIAPGGLTEQAAAEFVNRYGSRAATILAERAETAEELGHRVAARSWRGMADAAARLLRLDQCDLAGQSAALPIWRAADKPMPAGASRLRGR